MPMQKLQETTGFGRGAFALMVIGVMGFSLLLAGIARAGEIYSWTTVDGNVAFTDNPKNAQFTSEDSAETARYSDQLAKRVEYLRGMNSARAAAPAAAESVGVASITVSGVDLRLPAADPSAPIIVERLRVKSGSQIATRHDTLVSQGGTPLAIVRGSQRAESGGAMSILDEKDLEFYRSRSATRHQLWPKANAQLGPLRRRDLCRRFDFGGIEPQPARRRARAARRSLELLELLLGSREFFAR